MDCREFFVPVAGDWSAFIANQDPASGWLYDAEYEQKLWHYVAERRAVAASHKTAGFLVMNALRLMVFHRRLDPVPQLLAEARALASSVETPGNLRPDYSHFNPVQRAELEAPQRVRAYLMWAIALTAESARAPEPVKLIQAAEVVAAAYRGRSGKLPRDSARSDVLLGTMCALLAGHLDLAHELSSIRKSHPEQPKQFALFKRAATCLKVAGENSSFDDSRIDADFARQFFEVFNAYRLPVPSDQIRALGEADLMPADPLVTAYLYAWFYLKFFQQAGSGPVDLATLRWVMTG